MAAAAPSLASTIVEDAGSGSSAARLPATAPAVQVEAFGGPEVLAVADVPVPTAAELAPSEVLVHVHAIGINPVETYIRSGVYPRLPRLPFTPGNECAGVVVAAGSSARVRVGDRVFTSRTTSGSYATFARAPADGVHALPASVPFANGAAISVAYFTAFRALFQKGAACAGKTVLVHGATGGVGLAAVQLARAAGLRVLATGGSEVGRATLVEEGAESPASLNHRVPGSVLAGVLELTGGRGVDLVLEMLANANLGDDCKMVAPGGVIAVVGSRGDVSVTPRDLMSREASVVGVSLALATPEELAEAAAAVDAGLRLGALRPHVGRVFRGLAACEEAHREVLEHVGGAAGKIVVALDAEE